MANYEPQIIYKGNTLKYKPHPRYLRVRLDRALSFKSHIENTSAKLNDIIQKLAGTTWGASTSTLRISSLALVFSATEYDSSI